LIVIVVLLCFVGCKLQVLIDWINDELADFRIIVKDLEEDLFDGQILQKLIGTILLVCFYI